MITDRDIHEQVAVSVQEFGADIDVDSIVSEVIATYGLVSIEEIDSVEYWALVKRHDRGGGRPVSGQWRIGAVAEDGRRAIEAFGSGDA